MSDLPRYWQALDALAAAARSLEGSPVPDEEIPDVAGRTRAVEVRLQQYRLGLTSEFDYGSHKGSEYKVEVGRKGERNYNVMRIVGDFAAKRAVSPLRALLDLVNADVLRIQVMWKNLTTTFAANDITLIKANHELDFDEQNDLDGPHVGEYWKNTTPRVAALDPEERT